MASPCYVCHEPTTETSQCACRAVVHPECLLQCIRRSGKPSCTICKGVVGNVRVCRRRRLSRYVGCFVVLLSSTVVLCSIASMILLAMAAEEQRVHQFYDLLICCATSVAIATIASSFLQKLLHERDLVEDCIEYKYV
tara:strand:+ start:913 stop:1326 length:414 start_codon:yes stop_codon:yes gene_type:complete